MGIIVLLILSTFAVSLCASELSKETHADHATLTDALGSILEVAEAVAAVPLYIVAAMPMSALGRVRSVSVSYQDEGQLAQRQMQIMSRVKKGSTVELVDALGSTVRLVGTSQAMLVTPNGTEYDVCEGDASCSSVTVSNDDLQLYEEEALSMWENETETAAVDETGRRLDVAERRRLARRSLWQSGCAAQLPGTAGLCAPTPGWTLLNPGKESFCHLRSWFEEPPCGGVMHCMSPEPDAWMVLKSELANVQAKLANATAEGLIFKNAMCKNATFQNVYLSTECPLLPPLPPLLGR